MKIKMIRVNFILFRLDKKTLYFDDKEWTTVDVIVYGNNGSGTKLQVPANPDNSKKKSDEK